MRLWHQELIEKLPQKQLCGQWRECLVLLGNGWNKKHSVVNYVFEHQEQNLVAFTVLVINEMKKRGYHPNENLILSSLHKRHNIYESSMILRNGIILSNTQKENIYNEHNDEYMKECLDNLKQKGVEII